MGQKIMRFLGGYVRIRITGGSCDRFLNLCAYHRITLWELCCAGDSFEADLTRADFKRLLPVVRKSRTRVRIVKRYGLPFFVHRNRKRKMYLAGIAAAVLFLFWLSSHIWLITIEGNVSQTDDVLFEYLAGIGVTHGMPKSKVDCRALAAEIRNYFTDFTWVAARLKGTQLAISVKEGILKGEEEEGEEASQPSDLVASEAGTVDSIFVRSGLAQVEPGTQVEEGTVLVSGALPVYDDAGAVKSYQYVSSDADIVIRNTMEYYDKVPLAVQKKVYTGEVKQGFLLRVGEIPFGIGTAGAPSAHSDLLRTVTQAKLFENFYLPLYVERFTLKEYRYQEEKRTKEQAEEQARKNFTRFFEKLEEKGVQLFENDVRIEWYDDFCTVSGTLVAGKEAVRREIIHKEIQEELQADEYG